MKNLGTEANDLENRMKRCLTRLGLGHWKASWLPNSSAPVRGRTIPEKLSIQIYDVDEFDVWETFVHEIVEIKLRSALRPYRILVNKLIEAVQEIADGEKDRFIESLFEVFEAVRDSPPSS